MSVMKNMDIEIIFNPKGGYTVKSTNCPYNNITRDFNKCKNCPYYELPHVFVKLTPASPQIDKIKFFFDNKKIIFFII